LAGKKKEGTVKAKDAAAYLDQLLKICKYQGVKYLLCADSRYFKFLTKLSTVGLAFDAAYPVVIKGYEDIKVILSVNWKSLYYRPQYKSKLFISLKTLNEQEVPQTQPALITNPIYPSTPAGIRTILTQLHQYPSLTCDIEKKGLALGPVRTISFAWNKHEGTAFLVLPEIRDDLKEFFKQYQGTLIYHAASFDIKQIIYDLFMDCKRTNYSALIAGLDIMCQRVEDTKLLAYLCLNSTQGNELGLKTLAFHYTGNYAKDDIHDIDLIPPSELLQYNLTDAIATWEVFNKYSVKIKKEKQENIYKELFIPSLKVVIAMELVGIPVSIENAKLLDQKLGTLTEKSEEYLRASEYIKETQWKLALEKQQAANKKLKTIIKPAKLFYEWFNFRSSQQLAMLIHGVLRFPITSTTPTGIPSMDGDSLKKIYNQLVTLHKIPNTELYEI